MGLGLYNFSELLLGHQNDGNSLANDAAVLLPNPKSLQTIRKDNEVSDVAQDLESEHRANAFAQIPPPCAPRCDKPVGARLLPIVSIVVLFFGLTKYIIGIL